MPHGTMILRLERGNLFSIYQKLMDMYHGQEVSFVSTMNDKPLQMSGTAELALTSMPSDLHFDFEVQGGFLGNQSHTFRLGDLFYLDLDSNRIISGGDAKGFVMIELQR